MKNMRFFTMSKGLFMRSNSKEIDVIKKDNRLIEAKYKLTIHEQRLLWVLLGSITLEDEDFKKYTINISELAEQFGMAKSQSVYSEIQETCKSLLSRQLDISQGNRRIFVNWLSYVEYLEGKGKVIIGFHEALKPYLLQLKSHFTQYHISAVTQFKSVYSIRFYELIKMFEYKGNGGQFYRILSIQEIRDFMQLEENEYKLFADLKKRVIEPALKEMNEFSDICIVYIDYIKSGRAVVEIKIIAEPKTPEKSVVAIPDETTTEQYNPSKTALMDLGVSEETASKWLAKFDTAKITRNIAYTLAMQKQGEVKNAVAYLVKCIELDAAKGWEEQQLKQKEKTKLTKSPAKEESNLKDTLPKITQEENQLMLKNFWLLPEIRQDAMRDIFGAKQSDALRKMWRAEIKKGNKPEERAMFKQEFVSFIKSEADF